MQFAFSQKLIDQSQFSYIYVFFRYLIYDLYVNFVLFDISEISSMIVKASDICKLFKLRLNSWSILQDIYLFTLIYNDRIVSLISYFLIDIELIFWSLSCSKISSSGNSKNLVRLSIRNWTSLFLSNSNLSRLDFFTAINVFASGGLLESYDMYVYTHKNIHV